MAPAHDTFLPAVYDAPDLDTVIVAAYVAVDTFYQAEIAPHLGVRPGPAPRMSDSEILTLALLGQWRGSSERALLRWAAAGLGLWFPILLSQSAFHRRVHHLGPILTRLMRWLADQLGSEDTPYQIVDTTPVPLARQCRGERRRLFTAAEADIGYGGADRTWFYGCRLLLAVAADGPITGFVVGPGSIQDRWQLEALVTWRVCPGAPLRSPAQLPTSHAKGGTRVGPAGPSWWPESVGHRATGPLIGDTGFAGAAWQPYWRDALDQVVLTPAGMGRRATRQFSGWRQTVETINAVLIDTLHLHFPLAKTMWGVVRRLATKAAACNLGIWLNRQLGRDALALGSLFPG
jgi:hypothetical protein